MTDSLRARGENKYLQARWTELVKPEQREREDPRPPEEIALDIIKRAGITLI